MRTRGIIAGVVTGLAVVGCGGGQRQDAAEPHGKFPVQVSAASFPASQTLSQHAHMVISVRNAGNKVIPDVSVTVCNVSCAYPAPAGEGSSSQAFGADINQTYLANPSRPIWIVDRGPGACTFSCKNGGQGGATTAYSNTWALGRLAPGHTARFEWSVTAVLAGHHVLAWQVAAGLNGKAKAILSNGAAPHGTFTVQIGAKPSQTFVDNNGNIVTSPSPNP